MFRTAMSKKIYKRIYSRVPALLIAILFAGAVYGVNPGGGKENYFMLREMFMAWDDGFFGSRTYRKKQLNYFLVDLLGCEIQTGYDFLIDPELITSGGNFSSDVIYNKWLYIHGSMDSEMKNEDLPGFAELLREREINKTLFAVSGKIRKFRLEESSRGRFVHLYLERLRIEPLKK